jgi:hypothetical protein
VITTTDKRIVYTRPDGGVTICAPSSTALRYMTLGGGRWDEYCPGFLAQQIWRQVQDGIDERAAYKFMMAMQFGGCTEAEAYGIIRDRDCARNGVACELWHVSEILKLDRAYRDAWRRSSNGGPIYIDEHRAMLIDERRAWQAYEALH